MTASELQALAGERKFFADRAAASTAELHAAVRRAVAGGVRVALVAEWAGVSRETVYSIINRKENRGSVN